MSDVSATSALTEMALASVGGLNLNERERTSTYVQLHRAVGKDHVFLGSQKADGFGPAPSDRGDSGEISGSDRRRASRAPCERGHG